MFLGLIFPQQTWNSGGFSLCFLLCLQPISQDGCWAKDEKGEQKLEAHFAGGQPELDDLSKTSSFGCGAKRRLLSRLVEVWEQP